MDVISSASLPHLTDEVALHTLGRLHSLLLYDAELEDKQSHFEAEAAEYRQARYQLQEHIFVCKAKIAPVRRLPLEVLTQVFRFLITPSQRDLLHVSLVCKKWRIASLAPILWTNLVISAEKNREASKAGLSLKHTRELDLRVTYIQSSPRAQTWVWSTIIPSVCRWRVLSLTVDDCTVASSLIGMLRAARRLVELSVKIRYRCPKPADEGKFGFERGLNDNEPPLVQNCPLLRTLRLWTFVLPSPGRLFDVLTTLHITDTFACLEKPSATLKPICGPDLLNLLLECSSLVDFSFDGSESYRLLSANNLAAIQGRMISLPHLRRLHLDCHYAVGHYVLSFLTAEALETAVLKMRPRHEAHYIRCMEIPVSFLNRSQMLRSLHLYGFPTSVLVQGAVGGLRNLEELHLEYVPELDKVIEWFANPGAELHSDRRSWFAPRLSSLTIEAEPYDVPSKELATLVKERFDANAGGLEPSRIERLVVNEQDMLRGASPGEVAAFEKPQRFCGRKIMWIPTSQ